MTLLPAYKAALTKAKVIFCSNDETLNYILKRFGSNSAMKSKIHQLTELCIDSDYLTERMNLNKTQNELVHIIVSGRLIYRKGVQILLDCLPQIKTKSKYVIDIYGEGDQRQILEAFAKENNLEEKVFFHGKVTFEEMQEIYKNGDIYVLPSLRESTGTAVLEAMANKIPVITFNQNGAKYVVENDAGILVNLFTKKQVIHDLAKALEKLIDDDQLRIKLGQRGFNKLREKYTWSYRVKTMTELYEVLKKDKVNDRSMY